MKNKGENNEMFIKLTETPVGKLIRGLAVPTVISMMVAMIYNAADTFFVSRISVAASGATGIVFTVMGIIQACGFTFGHGAGSNISRLLGAKNNEAAKRFAATAFIDALLAGTIVAVPGIIFIEKFMTFLGSTPTILPYACEYAKYILIAGPALAGSCVLNNILRYEGMAKLAMIGLTSGGILNMIFDPILIFGFNMGITGAGLATAVSQYISLIILMLVFIFGKTQSSISPKYFSFSPKTFWLIVSTGAPSFARQALNSVSTMVLNRSAAPYGDACIAAMSIVSKCSMAIFSVGVGIGQGFQPVSSFNYGAGRYKRVRDSIVYVLKLDTIVCGILSAVMFAFAPQIVSLFRPEEEIIKIGGFALRCLCCAMLLLPTIVIGNMTFQSVGKTGRAFLLACSQNGLFYIPLIFILNRYIGLTGIEIAQPVAYLAAFCVAVPFLSAFAKHLTQKEEHTLKE